MTFETFHCSICGRRVKMQSRLDMPVLDPNTGFGICKNCIKNIYHYIEDEEGHRAHNNIKNFDDELGELLAKNKPHVIKKYLDEFIIMQERAKKVRLGESKRRRRDRQVERDNFGTDGLRQNGYAQSPVETFGYTVRRYGFIKFDGGGLCRRGR